MPKGRKSQFNTAQEAHLNSYIEDFKTQLDAGTTGIALTRLKQGIATKALASPAFQDLDVRKPVTRNRGSEIHQLLQQCLEEGASRGAVWYPTLVTNNPLLKFASILNGRQTFAREKAGTISIQAAQRVQSTGINDASWSGTVDYYRA
ncbi:hypothetical protein R3P38DRAFT_3516953 [Favolaschia claudopus]|uniref:Uncharacterized protein n=1 Tax=Favolaschia claudopus TaxID=2862362 RepID=A0AAV9YZ50_9AGAR